VERRVIRVRRHWAMLLPVLCQTVGIVLGVFLLSLLVGGVSGLWLVQSLLGTSGSPGVGIPVETLDKSSLLGGQLSRSASLPW
jgi:hypothetical protein